MTAGCWLLPFKNKFALAVAAMLLLSPPLPLAAFASTVF